MEVMPRYREAADVAWKVGRIMLKYRPIAPKPVTGGGVAAGPVDSKAGGGRGKRRGGAADGSRRGRKSAKRSPPASTDAAGAFSEETFSPPVVTLPLMPVTPERKEVSPPATPSPTASDGHVAVSFFGKPPTWQQHVGTTTTSGSSCSSGPSPSSVVVAPRPVRPVGSWVTVECVTDTWRAGEVGPVGLAMATDTCPVFVSDACDRVTWTNEAYKRMVVGPTEDDDEEAAMRVALVTRGMVPADAGVTCFTCRVRVRYACRRKGKVSMAAPCDVWRLADGSLAWRLDVKAALSLSLWS